MAAWRREVRAIKANMDLGVHAHGGDRRHGSRSSPSSRHKLASGNTDNSVWAVGDSVLAAGNTDKRLRSSESAASNSDTARGVQ